MGVALFYDSKIPLSAVCAVDGVEPHTTAAYVYLKAIGSCFTSCTHSSPLGGVLDRAGKQGPMNPGGAILSRARALRTRINMEGRVRAA
jgi:hypothetical protein